MKYLFAALIMVGWFTAIFGIAWAAAWLAVEKEEWWHEFKVRHRRLFAGIAKVIKCINAVLIGLFLLMMLGTMYYGIYILL